MPWSTAQVTSRLGHQQVSRAADVFPRRQMTSLLKLILG